MKKRWYSPQSRMFEELVRAMRNALAMVGLMAVAIVLMGWLSK